MFWKQLFLEERDILEAISANYWKKHGKEVVVERGEYGIGELSYPLRGFSPKESAEFANEIQKFVLKKLAWEYR